MSVYGTPLGVSLPTPSDPVNWPGSLYAEQVNAVLEAIIERLESKVTAAGLAFVDAWDLGGNALRDLMLVTHDVTVTPPAGPSSYFLGINWYLMDGEDREIQMTESGALSATIAAGVTGAGYGAGGVEIYWDGSAQRFVLKESASSYADVEVGALYFQDEEASPEAVGLRPPATSANYSVSMPAAMASEVGQLAIDDAGQLSVLTRPRHQNLSLLIPLSQDMAGQGFDKTADKSLFVGDGASPDVDLVVRAPMRAGDRIQSITVYMIRSAGVWNLALSEVDYTDASQPRYTDRVTGSGTTNSWAATTGAPYTLLDGKVYEIRLTGNSSLAGNIFVGLKVVYDRP